MGVQELIANLDNTTH